MGLRKNFMNEEALQVTLVNSRGWNEDNVRHPSADSPAEALRGWMSYTLALGKIGRRRSPPAALNLRQRLHMCVYLNWNILERCTKLIFPALWNDGWCSFSSFCLSILSNYEIINIYCYDRNKWKPILKSSYSLNSWHLLIKKICFYSSQARGMICRNLWLWQVQNSLWGWHMGTSFLAGEWAWLTSQSANVTIIYYMIPFNSYNNNRGRYYCFNFTDKELRILYIMLVIKNLGS